MVFLGEKGASLREWGAWRFCFLPNICFAAFLVCAFVCLSACEAKPEGGEPGLQKDQSFATPHDSTRKAKASHLKLIIDMPDTENDFLYSYPLAQKMSVLAVMRSLQKQGGLQFSEKSTGLGTLIQSIHGKKNRKNCPCWLYAVNGRLAATGVSEMQVKAGDQIRWCYLKYEDRKLCK